MNETENEENENEENEHENEENEYEYIGPNISMVVDIVDKIKTYAYINGMIILDSDYCVSDLIDLL